MTHFTYFTHKSRGRCEGVVGLACGLASAVKLSHQNSEACSVQRASLTDRTSSGVLQLMIGTELHRPRGAHNAFYLHLECFAARKPGSSMIVQPCSARKRIKNILVDNQSYILSSIDRSTCKSFSKLLWWALVLCHHLLASRIVFSNLEAISV